MDKAASIYFFQAQQELLLLLIALLPWWLPILCYPCIYRHAKELGQYLKKLSRKRPKEITFDLRRVKV
jgi:lauroyl/myristoyl acyltransferase